MIAGVLENEKTQRKPVDVESESESDERETVEPTPSRGRGGSSTRSRTSTPAKRTTKPRTIHLADDLFERILVQAHRRDRTISEYVAGLLDRHVPDHRVVRSTGVDEDAA